MRDTKQEIVKLADRHIRSRGFNAFSYTDISKVLAIKNAAIHYYFPSKFDLGVAVIEKTIDTFEWSSQRWSELDYAAQLEQYMEVYDRSKAENCVCLMGALAPAYDTLSAEMQQALRLLGQTLLAWLTRLLEAGRNAGVFTFKGAARDQAYVFQSALLASLLLDKVLQENVCATIKAGILNN
ncbi:TetR/AcrR family transcriptional regulator [Flavobacterium sp. JP2137]|uniref:TetR/AcrR family transcriptional regulator n=1 Tax=Flavobacterium sp. JP2137 TaxID=3414510 RepID=UPI003D2FC726